MRSLAPWLGLILLIASAHAAGRELVVGVQPYLPARALIAYHEKLAAHLHGALKQRVRIVTAPEVDTFGRRILAGDYDLALAPAHLALLAVQDAGWQPLARYVPDTSVLLLARRDDVDATPASLRGRALATHGRLRLSSVVAEHWLAAQQLQAGRDYRRLETASPAGAVQALVEGEADMAAVTLASMAQARRSHVEQVRIVHEVAPLPLLFFIARGDMTPVMREKIQRALLAYQAPQGGRPVAAGRQDLASMEAYLTLTRQLLQGSTEAEPGRQVAR